MTDISMLNIPSIGPLANSIIKYEQAIFSCCALTGLSFYEMGQYVRDKEVSPFILHDLLAIGLSLDEGRQAARLVQNSPDPAASLSLCRRWITPTADTLRQLRRIARRAYYMQWLHRIWLWIKGLW